MERTTCRNSNKQTHKHLPDAKVISNEDLGEQLRHIAGMMQTLETDLNRVAREVSKLKPLADDVVAHVNSAQFGLAHNVSRIEHAVAILGRRRTLAMVRHKLNPDENIDKILEKISREEKQRDSA